LIWLDHDQRACLLEDYIIRTRFKQIFQQAFTVGRSRPFFDRQGGTEVGDKVLDVRRLWCIANEFE
jgi:hypothetical protein